MLRLLFFILVLPSVVFAQGDSLKSPAYETVIGRGDSSFRVLNVVVAKLAYQEAHLLRPEESYPIQMILECDRYLSNHCGSPRYDRAIKAGDSLFKTENYAAAKRHYQEAIGLRSSEDYPARQIVLCDQMIAASERNRTAQTKYDRILVVADSLFKVGDYSNAKLKYFDAQQIHPEEIHPKDQIEWCDFKLAGIQYQQEYAAAIKTADSAFAEKNFRLAKSWYLTALNLRPSEQYPRWQMGKCDEFLKED